jgi:hypothetical protein
MSIIAAEVRKSGRTIADAVLRRLLEHWDKRKKEKDERRAEEEHGEEARRAAEGHKEKARKVGAEKGATGGELCLLGRMMWRSESRRMWSWVGGRRGVHIVVVEPEAALRRLGNAKTKMKMEM